jgi:2-dehydro-3-deoxygalactonokinase
MTERFIALDWGSTSFRAYLADRSGAVFDSASAPAGILSVSDGDFDAALERLLPAWGTSLPVMAAGMITSRQGWIELPYVPCPAGAADLAAALRPHVSKRGRVIHFSTGLSCRSKDGMPDVMRSEETQVLGSLESGSAVYVAPGTHSKWIDAASDRIAHFSTYVTGEVFAALRTHTLIGKLIVDAPHDGEAFARGVKAALADPGGLLHRVFSVRSLALFGEMKPEHLASYLSGQVIGTEVAHARASRPETKNAIILASEGIGSRYAEAMAIAGIKANPGNSLAIVRGLAKIAVLGGVLS